MTRGIDSARQIASRSLVPPPVDALDDGVAQQSSRLVALMSGNYAWVVLAASTIGLILTSPGQTYAVSIFIERFIQDLGISRSLVSALYTVGTLTASMGLPLIGRLIDRNGMRAMVAFIALGLGVACLYMGSVRGPVMLVLGFVALRMFGQGSLEPVSKTVINHWWVRRRGMATGISSLLSSVLGTGLWSILIQALIAFVGWRAAYRWLGLGIATWAASPVSPT
jgi:MFS transporter, OFA family, oxalate/formate antiporter